MEWIPVEERLPEECKEYMVTAFSKTWGCDAVYLDMYIPNKKKFCIDGVKAWAEVPAPYRQK